MSYRNSLCAVAIALFCTRSLGSDPSDWTSFRGPNGSGVGSGDPPAKWDVQTGENVKWKVALPGLAHSSPITWGDRIFINTAVSLKGDAKVSTGWVDGTGDSANDDGEWEWKVLCLDQKSGKTLWERTAHKGVPKFKRHLKATHANSTPATDGKYVVSYFATEGLYCHDFDGALIWKKDLGPMNASPGGYADLQWGVASSPIIHDGNVYLQCDVQGASYWTALDLKDGRELMKIERGDDSTWTTPTIFNTKNGSQLVCNGFKKMAGYDLKTGKELWMMQGGGDVPVPRPVIAGDLVILTNAHGRKPIYAVRPDAAGDVTPKDDVAPAGLAWWNKVKGSYMPTPIVVGDVLYIADDSGILTALEAATGKQLFRERIPGGGKSTYSASPVSAGGKIYITSEDGNIDVVKAGKTFEHLASNQMGEVCMATPAIADGKLYVRGEKHLYCIGK